MKSVAVLLDGGFVRHVLYRLLGKKHPCATDITGFAHACLTKGNEELFRIYYYDCPPWGEQLTNPISGQKTDYSTTATHRRSMRLLDELRVSNHVAVRSGQLMYNGWVLKEKVYRELIKSPRSIVAADIEPELKQKTVDTKIGLDIAWLASKHIVDRLVLVTSDTDFVPAMKFARREGVQVVLVRPGGKNTRKELVEHADEVRDVAMPGVPASKS